MGASGSRDVVKKSKNSKMGAFSTTSKRNGSVTSIVTVEAQPPQQPPDAVISAAESRGDTMTFSTLAGTEVQLSVCKWRQLELFESGNWLRRLDGISLVEETSEIETLHLTDSDDQLITSLSRTVAEEISSKLERLCCRAAISYNIEVTATPKCKYCNEFKTSVMTTCSVNSRLHIVSDYIEDEPDVRSQASSEEQNDPTWNSATMLPPGTIHSEPSTPTLSCASSVTAMLPSKWECGACCYVNTKVKYAKQCKVCGAERPPPSACNSRPMSAATSETGSIPLTPNSRSSGCNYGECPACKKSLRNAPAFCPATGKPHALPSPRMSPKNAKRASRRVDTSSFPSSSDVLQMSADLEESPKASGVACLSCFTATKNTVLQPCRHLVVCSSCAPDLVNCPQCGSSITARLEIYA
eukprot:TRINITY_DN20116_c0_g1_i1.p1 TRINITY_DN20116_c0_g1~~TRINITY_DN20116_c0_g1_i1.p1  ORF type:complete len:412 (+),score=67.17 TRINITY_DN20116_c0_g1_i1:41-1276(+)